MGYRDIGGSQGKKITEASSLEVRRVLYSVCVRQRRISCGCNNFGNNRTSHVYDHRPIFSLCLMSAVRGCRP